MQPEASSMRAAFLELRNLMEIVHKRPTGEIYAPLRSGKGNPANVHITLVPQRRHPGKLRAIWVLWDGGEQRARTVREAVEAARRLAGS